ncbi:MAG TPA: serine hydrolase domain-containing protein [Tepidisphaeraceae bacterium]|nr:serine hydrolase domain-containing protein [Tepidisphaeraceae bacterium]
MQVRPEDRARKVDALFARWESNTTPGGVVGIIRDGVVIYEHPFGMANLDFSIPNTPRTLFHIASISKQFTAFAILLLQQDSRLSLDDDVRKYVPELPDFGKTITLRHLLHHTSGFPVSLWVGSRPSASLSR